MPHPREAAPLVVEALREVFGAGLACAILKGSALKGDWIPYYSDLDVHGFVRGLDEHGSVPWREAAGLQERIARIDPDAYQIAYVQLTLLPETGYTPDLAQPLPGTYEVLYGAVPSSFHAPVDHRAHARESLARLPAYVASMNRSYWDKPDRGATRIVRLAGTFLKDALYDVAKLLVEPEHALRLERDELVALAGGATESEKTARAYYALAWRWRTVRERPELLREMYAHGMAALDAIIDWAAKRS